MEKFKYTGLGQKMLLHCEGVIHFVNPAEILYLQADGSYTNVGITGRGIIRVSKNLRFVFGKVPPEYEYFFRVGRSWIVNLNRTTAIATRGTRIWLSMDDGTEIDLANVNMRKKILARYQSHLDQHGGLMDDSIAE